jgi:hypothetical protein
VDELEMMADGIKKNEGIPRVKILILTTNKLPRVIMLPRIEGNVPPAMSRVFRPMLFQSQRKSHRRGLPKKESNSGEKIDDKIL